MGTRFEIRCCSEIGWDRFGIIGNSQLPVRRYYGVWDTPDHQYVFCLDITCFLLHGKATATNADYFLTALLGP